jgi:tetratricopeptide (TPR) repeat protein
VKQVWIVVVILMLTGCEFLSDVVAENPIRRNQIAITYNEGDYEKAIADFEAYLARYPRDDLAWTILGHAFENLDQYDEAEQAYDAAIAINPKRFEAITGLGILHRVRGEYDEAMAAYELALSIDPNYAQAYSSMTTIALKKNKDEKALEYASRGYELDPLDPVIAANLAVAYHYNNDFENRDRFAEKAKELGYTNFESLNGIFAGELTIRD